MRKLITEIIKQLLTGALTLLIRLEILNQTKMSLTKQIKRNLAINCLPINSLLLNPGRILVIRGMVKFNWMPRK